MEKRQLISIQLSEFAIIILILIGLYLISLSNYLLFHTVVELFSVVIAECIFTIAWATRHYIKESFYPISGCLPWRRG